MAYPDETRRRAVDAYSRGSTARAVAADVGCAYPTVLAWCRAAGVPIRSRGRARGRGSDRQRLALSLRRGGAKISEIADMLGVTKQAASGLVKRALQAEGGER